MDEAEEENGVKLENWEWRVTTIVLRNCMKLECSLWRPENVFAYVCHCHRSREAKSERAFDYLSVAGQLV